MSVVLFNLYKKSREHPFLFTKDYEHEFDEGMKKLLSNDIVFITSAGDNGVFDLIVKNTKRQYKYTQVGQEYIGCIYKNNITIRNIVVIENSFEDFESIGKIFVDFHIRIGRKNLIVRVAHFYNCEQTELSDSDGVDLMLRTSDPVL